MTHKTNYKPFDVVNHTEQLDAIMKNSPFVPPFLRESEIKKAHMREVGKTDRWLLISSVAYVLFFVVLLVAVWLR